MSPQITFVIALIRFLLYEGAKRVKTSLFLKEFGTRGIGRRCPCEAAPRHTLHLLRSRRHLKLSKPRSLTGTVAIYIARSGSHESA